MQRKYSLHHGDTEFLGLYQMTLFLSSVPPAPYYLSGLSLCGENGIF